MNLHPLGFNPNRATVMHVDINSCFATIEQQANPLLRGKPVAVCAYVSPRGCVLAASVEAKRFGVKTGMRLGDAQKIIPDIVALPSDPDKYRHVHKGLKKILERYTHTLIPKSIDEFVLDIGDYMDAHQTDQINIGQKIKSEIKRDVGDWITVSIGIGVSRFIAKTASNYQKPDGLTLIDKENFLAVYKSLKLTDLNGINFRLERRLNGVGIHFPLQFYKSSIADIKKAFLSVGANYWYLRLRGWDIDTAEFATKSVGNSYSLPRQFCDKHDLSPILSKLAEKTGFRLRKKGYRARGVFLGVGFVDGTYWSLSKTYPSYVSSSMDIFKRIMYLFAKCPAGKPVRFLSEGVFELIKNNYLQLDATEDLVKKQNLTHALDSVNKKWGLYTIYPARMFSAAESVVDRIAFGKAEKYA